MLQVIAAIAASATIASSGPSIRIAAHETRPAPRPHYRTPGIRIWTSGSDLHHRGERVQLYYRTERDAYVTIFRVDTDGRVQILFPRYPGEENYGYGGATYSVANYDRSSAFYVDDYPGVGYIFAVASTDPFNYDAVVQGNNWDLNDVSDGRVHGDPRSSLEEISAQLLPPEYADFDTHLLPYYVEQRYDYPRFVCYDCHAYTPYLTWDPYLAWCRRFTLVVYNDPYYYYPSYWYPTRYYGGVYYGGTRVVYPQPRDSRYVFKSRENSAPGIDYRDRRATETASRRPDNRGVRGSDLGGTGSVPAPRTPTRRVAPPLGEGGGGGGGGGTGGGGDRRGDRYTAGEDQRDPPVVGAGDTRRRPDGDGSPTNSLPANEAGRRRVDAQPGIEIVPNGDRPSSDRSSSGDRPATRDGQQPRPDGRRQAGNETEQQSRSAAPADRAGYGSEPRPTRPDGAARPDDSRSRRSSEDQPRASAPEQVRQPERGQPERIEAPRNDRPVESQPREARPQPSAPREASPPRESSPQPRDARPSSPPPREQSRPQASPQSRPSNGGSNPGLVRRRP